MTDGIPSNFRDAALHATTRIVSVDVFDTLLLRTTEPEHKRFLGIAVRQHRALKEAGMSVEASPEDLHILRIMAARAAYRNRKPQFGAREASYDDIYSVIVAALGLPHSAISIARTAELDYEKSALRPNKDLVQTLEQAHDAGKRIICISDMYLSAEDIRVLVDHHFPDLPVSQIYSSADHGFGKASGYLYHHVAQQEGVDTREIAHCGDNQWSDYESAANQNVMSYHMPRERLWRWTTNLRRRLYAFGLGLD